MRKRQRHRRRRRHRQQQRQPLLPCLCLCRRKTRAARERESVQLPTRPSFSPSPPPPPPSPRNAFAIDSPSMGHFDPTINCALAQRLRRTWRSCSRRIGAGAGLRATRSGAAGLGLGTDERFIGLALLVPSRRRRLLPLLLFCLLYLFCLPVPFTAAAAARRSD